MRFDPDNWFRNYWRGRPKIPRTRWDAVVLDAEQMWRRGGMTVEALALHLKLTYHILGRHADEVINYVEEPREVIYIPPAEVHREEEPTVIVLPEHL